MIRRFQGTNVGFTLFCNYHLKIRSKLCEYLLSNTNACRKHKRIDTMRRCELATLWSKSDCQIGADGKPENVTSSRTRRAASLPAGMLLTAVGLVGRTNRLQVTDTVFRTEHCTIITSTLDAKLYTMPLLCNPSLVFRVALERTPPVTQRRTGISRSHVLCAICGGSRASILRRLKMERKFLLHYDCVNATGVPASYRTQVTVWSPCAGTPRCLERNYCRPKIFFLPWKLLRVHL